MGLVGPGETLAFLLGGWEPWRFLSSNITGQSLIHADPSGCRVKDKQTEGRERGAVSQLGGWDMNQPPYLQPLLHPRPCCTPPSLEAGAG